jgi:hypothetical protein
MAPRRERAADSRPRVLDTARLLGLSPADAAELGARCRCLLDSARARFLGRRGFKVGLVSHVPFAHTADNVMLLCVARQEHEREPATTAGALCAECEALPAAT